MSNTKLIPINHFRAFVAEGELFLTASSVEGVQRLSTLFPNAKWPWDEDGCKYCDTGIRVQDQDIRFDDDGYDERSRKRERARVACVAADAPEDQDNRDARIAHLEQVCRDRADEAVEGLRVIRAIQAEITELDRKLEGHREGSDLWMRAHAQRELLSTVLAAGR